MKATTTQIMADEIDLATQRGEDLPKNAQEIFASDVSTPSPSRWHLPAPERFTDVNAALSAVPPLPSDLRPDITGKRPVLARGSVQIAECLRTFLAQRPPTTSLPFVLEL